MKSIYPGTSGLAQNLKQKTSDAKKSYSVLKVVVAHKCEHNEY